MDHVWSRNLTVGKCLAACTVAFTNILSHHFNLRGNRDVNVRVYKTDARLLGCLTSKLLLLTSLFISLAAWRGHLCDSLETPH